MPLRRRFAPDVSVRIMIATEAASFPHAACIGRVMKLPSKTKPEHHNALARCAPSAPLGLKWPAARRCQCHCQIIPGRSDRGLLPFTRAARQLGPGRLFVPASGATRTGPSLDSTQGWPWTSDPTRDCGQAPGSNAISVGPQAAWNGGGLDAPLKARRASWGRARSKS